MSFRVLGLDPTPFRPLYGLSEQALADRGALRMVADAGPGYPDRVEMRHAARGEPILLVNFTHQAAETPYRSSHAIFVCEGAETRYDAVDEVPEVMRLRTLSVRAFDAAGMMVDADLVDGQDAGVLFDRMLSNPDADYLHVHYAKRGCYSGRVERAST